MSDVEMPSLFQFSALDAASAVDYSKGTNVDDGVVDSPPAKVVKLNYAPSPSPLRSEKRARVLRSGASPSKDSAPKGLRSNRRLCMDQPPCDVPALKNLPAIAVTAPVIPLPAPVDIPKAQTDIPKAKVPNFDILNFVLPTFHILLHLCALEFADLHP